jgi:peptidyl-prolyl cis-trans isomerase B (cyclophilin B)
LASKSNRQRRLERARTERRIARRAEQVRRRRQIQAGIGAAIALVLIVLGTVWALGGFSPTPPQTVASGSCTWTLQDPKTNPDVIDTGHPPTDGELRSGFATLTFKTNLGDIEARMNLTQTPCTGASFNYLAGKNYYKNSTCTQLDTDQKLLTCGDPKNNGTGNPSYQYANELVPTAPIGGDPTASPTTATPTSPTPTDSASPSAAPAQTYYAKGTIVMLNTGANTNSGQFYIVYGDGSTLSNAYTIVGTITKGLDLVTGVADAGAAPGADGTTGPTGKPNKDLTIQSVVFSPVSAVPSDSTGSPAASTTPPTTPTATPS